MFNLIYTIIPIVCLSAGFYFGFKIARELQIPQIPYKIKHPIQAIKEQKRISDEEETFNKELNNLNNYDGTSSSQEDI